MANWICLHTSYSVCLLVSLPFELILLSYFRLVIDCIYFHVSPFPVTLSSVIIFSPMCKFNQSIKGSTRRGGRVAPPTLQRQTRGFLRESLLASSQLHIIYPLSFSSYSSLHHSSLFFPHKVLVAINIIYASTSYGRKTRLLPQILPLRHCLPQYSSTFLWTLLPLPHSTGREREEGKKERKKWSKRWIQSEWEEKLDERV